MSYELVNESSGPNGLHKTIESFASNPKFTALHITHIDPKKVFKRIYKSYRIIKAAGGIVKNQKGEMLFIFRRNRWDLPKGKMERRMENGEWRMEKKKEAATREVEEECGINGVNILRKLFPTYHMYTIKGEWVVKKTYWYEMLYTDDKLPVPQKEEGITGVRWFQENEINEVYQNTFLSVHELVSSYLNKIS